MSCEAAALIIAGMGGIWDEGQVRSQLGCNGDEECNVKNMQVLQVLDMDC
jgi:hypothetical protein